MTKLRKEFFQSTLCARAQRPTQDCFLSSWLSKEGVQTSTGYARNGPANHADASQSRGETAQKGRVTRPVRAGCWKDSIFTKGEFVSVIVLDRSGKPLMPCSEHCARKLLAAGRAREYLLEKWYRQCAYKTHALDAA